MNSIVLIIMQFCVLTIVLYSALQLMASILFGSRNASVPRGTLAKEIHRPIKTNNQSPYRFGAKCIEDPIDPSLQKRIEQLQKRIEQVESLSQKSEKDLGTLVRLMRADDARLALI